VCALWIPLEASQSDERHNPPREDLLGRRAKTELAIEVMDLFYHDKTSTKHSIEAKDLDQALEDLKAWLKLGLKEDLYRIGIMEVEITLVAPEDKLVDKKRARKARRLERKEMAERE
jgi:hypothetical protein